jgi:hypothetical protein
MTRGLKRRVDAVWEAIGGDTDAVLLALDMIRSGGRPPDGNAGARAARVWEESRHLDEPIRGLWCVLRVRGMTLAEWVAEGR